MCGEKYFLQTVFNTYNIYHTTDGHVRYKLYLKGSVLPIETLGNVKSWNIYLKYHPNPISLLKNRTNSLRLETKLYHV